MDIKITIAKQPQLHLMQPECNRVTKATLTLLSAMQVAGGIPGLEQVHDTAKIALDALFAFLAAALQDTLRDDPDATGGHAAVEQAAAEQVTAGPGGTEVSDDIATNG